MEIILYCAVLFAILATAHHAERTHRELRKLNEKMDAFLGATADPDPDSGKHRQP